MGVVLTARSLGIYGNPTGKLKEFVLYFVGGGGEYFLAKLENILKLINFIKLTFRCSGSPVISVPGRLRQEDHSEFQPRLSYIVNTTS